MKYIYNSRGTWLISLFLKKKKRICEKINLESLCTKPWWNHRHFLTCEYRRKWSVPLTRNTSRPFLSRVYSPTEKRTEELRNTGFQRMKFSISPRRDRCSITGEQFFKVGRIAKLSLSLSPSVYVSRSSLYYYHQRPVKAFTGFSLVSLTLARETLWV